MSAFTERFDREVSFSEDMKAYHVRVNGVLLTDDDKNKLLARYEREMMKPVLGWRVEMAGLGWDVVPLFAQQECNQDTFASFTKAKAHLTKELQASTDRLRAETARARKLLKADVVAASVSDDEKAIADA